MVILLAGSVVPTVDVRSPELMNASPNCVAKSSISDRLARSTVPVFSMTTSKVTIELPLNSTSGVPTIALAMPRSAMMTDVGSAVEPSPLSPTASLPLSLRSEAE